MGIVDGVGLLAVGIYDGLVFNPGLEEVEVEVDRACHIGIYAAGRPVLAVLVLACHYYKFARFGIDIFTLAPVEGHVFDKLEGIHALEVVLRGIGSHLEG